MKERIQLDWSRLLGFDQVAAERRLEESGLAKSGIKLPSSAEQALETLLQKKSKDFTRKDLLSLKTEQLAAITRINEADLRRLKLTWLGVKFKSARPAQRHR